MGYLHNIFTLWKLEAVFESFWILNACIWCKILLTKKKKNISLHHFAATFLAQVIIVICFFCVFSKFSLHMYSKLSVTSITQFFSSCAKSTLKYIWFYTFLFHISIIELSESQHSHFFLTFHHRFKEFQWINYFSAK